jgi:hypothetical protein
MRTLGHGWLLSHQAFAKPATFPGKPYAASPQWQECRIKRLQLDRSTSTGIWLAPRSAARSNSMACKRSAVRARLAPLEAPGRGICQRPDGGISRSFDRHLTVDMGICLCHLASPDGQYMARRSSVSRAAVEHDDRPRRGGCGRRAQRGPGGIVISERSGRNLSPCPTAGIVTGLSPGLAAPPTPQ